MPLLMLIETFSGPSVAGPTLFVIGVAVAVVCLVILVRLYRPKHLDGRAGAGGGRSAGDSTAGFWGCSPGDSGGGFDGGGGGGQC